MSETAIKTETQDNDGVVKTEKEVKEKDGKQRSVSFNRDVHVKRFGESIDVVVSHFNPFVCNVYIIISFTI